MRILALDGASADGAGFALLHHDPVADDAGPSRSEAGHWEAGHWEAGQGAAVRLPVPLRAALRQAGWDPRGLDLIAVLVGPGSFTGLRASLALAHGLALAGAAALVGVSVGEAFAASSVGAERWPVWCLSQARRDRVFLELLRADGGVAPPLSCAPDALPEPYGAPLLAGDARALVASALRARGIHSRPGPPRPDPSGIARAALRRLHGRLPPLPAQPLYVDPPRTTVAAAGAAAP